MFIPPFWCGVAVGFMASVIFFGVLAVVIGSDSREDE